MKLYKVILSCLKKCILSLIIYFILSISLNYLITYIPVVIQYFLDILLKQETNNYVLDVISNLFIGKVDFIFIICGMLLIIQLFIVIITYLRNIIKSRIIQELQFKLKLFLFDHIQKLTYQDFYQNSLADLVQNSSDDINNIISFVDKQLSYILDIVLVIIFVLLQLNSLNILLSITMIISVSLIIIISIWYFIKSKKIILNKMNIQKMMYDKLNDNYSNIKHIKINNLQKAEQEKFEVINQQNYNINTKQVVVESWYHMLVANIIKLQNPFIFILSAYLYKKGLITIGIIYVTISYSNRVTRSFSNISEIIEFFSSCIVSYKRLNNLLCLTLEDNDKKPSRNIKNTKIIFNNVSIIVNSKTILKNLNFEIDTNEKILIVGSTGSGKSILLKTLIGFYEYQGSIRIDGIELRELNKKDTREIICLLLQDSYLFSKTIAENIKILVPYLTDNIMISLSKFFSLHQEIENFNDSYNTIIGKKGISLSKGQRQRLVLIRAYTKPKPIMVFDDSFSAIDQINKYKILDNLLKLDDKSTKIFISHNISLAPNFKKVIFINNNTAICSNHYDLMGNENYRKLYELSCNEIGDDYV